MVKNALSTDIKLYHALLTSDNSVFVYNLDKLTSLYKNWCSLFPNIVPHYAVKCNPNPKIIKHLGNLGASFDCASASEIRSVLSEGVSSNRIIYANPCKTEKELAYALKNKIQVTTFDSVCEIEKLITVSSKCLCKPMDLVLRIHAYDPKAKCVLSNKYGATEKEWDTLMEKAKQLELNIVGISFHIGSGACTPSAYNNAVHLSRMLYDRATYTYGFDIKTLDIGGGFTDTNISKMAPVIKASLRAYFPESLGVKVISEPGRYFAETCADLYTKIMGVKERITNDNVEMHYTITDSLYGSFNNVIYDHAILNPVPVQLSTCIEGIGRFKNLQNKNESSIIYGSTCDGVDKICTVDLPRLKYGDWLLWKNMGAYTIAGACDFNGIEFTSPTEIYITSP